jgi:hypothetical protein
MTVEEALAFVDAILTPDRLSAIQELIFRQCWAGQTYQEIAVSSGYDPDYIRVIGSQLWQKLSQIFAERVTKNNFRSVLRQRSRDWQESRRVAKPREPDTPQPSSPSELPAPEFPEGPVPLDSPFYLERPPIEERAYEEIAKPGALIRIKAPRQWGKTSLMARILAQAKNRGYQIVRLNMQQTDESVLVSLYRFLRWFCANVSQQLQLEPRLDDYWDLDLGSKVSCTTYLQGYVLAQIDSPLVLALDEVQRIFEHPDIAQDFLPLLRFWHEEANNLDIWKKLRLVVSHSTEVYIPLNLNQSPFNVGLPIQVREFSFENIWDLAVLHRLNWVNEESGLQQLIALQAMLDGHPYLLRLAFYHLFRKEIVVEQLLADAPTQTGIYSDHLRGHLAMLQAYPELAVAFKRVVTADQPVQLESILAYKLESTGLVNLVGNDVTPRCDLYRQYFQERLDQF